MDLLEIFRPLIKWWWMLVLAAVIAGVSALLFVRGVPPVYLSRTTLMAGQALFEPNPSDYELNLSQQLARAYVQMAYREPVKEATKAALGLDELPEYEVRAVPGGSMIEIDVTYTDPQLAQSVAAALAEQLILQSPSAGGNAQNVQQQQFIQAQLVDIEKDIRQTKDEIVAKQEALAGLERAVDIAAIEEEIRALGIKLNSLQGIYADLLANTQQGSINTLSIFEPAGLPILPIGPNKPLIVLASAIGGLVLAAGAAYVIEFFSEDVIRTKEDAERVLGMPVVGFIHKTPKTEEQGLLYIAENPISPEAEAFRTLRTNLTFIAADKPIRSLLITSAEPEAGKSFVSASLAYSLAQSPKSILLVDADLRKPTVHKRLGEEMRAGLSEVLQDEAKLEAVKVNWLLDDLCLLPAGIHLDPTALLNAKKLETLIDELHAQFDMVIVDSPPLITAETLILASMVDAVLLVARAGHTSKKQAHMVAEQLKRANANVLGAALNMSSGGRNYYYYHYYNK